MKWSLVKTSIDLLSLTRQYYIVGLFCLFLFSWQIFIHESLLHPSTWGLFIQQFYHNGFTHMFFNIAGLILLIIIAPELFLSLAWLVQLLLCGWAANALYLFINGDAIIPIGMSGGLHGLTWLIAMALLYKQNKLRNIIGLLLTIALTLKLIYEQVFGTLPSSTSFGLVVVTDMHLYGVIAALWVRVLFHIVLRMRSIRHEQQLTSPWYGD